MKKDYECLADYGSIGPKQVKMQKCEIHLQRCSWYGKKMWDIRTVDELGVPTYKGLTMTTEHIKKLRDLLNEIDLESIND